MSTFHKSPILQESACNRPWLQLVGNAKAAVFALQTLIHFSTHAGNGEARHRAQLQLMCSPEALTLAVDRVTRISSGRKTPGVDGRTATTDEERFLLVAELAGKTLKHEFQPLRESWMPKPESDTERRLEIPTTADRVILTSIHMALTPEWEARLGLDSLAYRPGWGHVYILNTVATAIAARTEGVHTLEVDVKDCFDEMAHEPVLDLLDISPRLKRLIRDSLRAGVVDRSGGVRHSDGKGIHQGSPLAPLLCNVALHGLGGYICGNPSAAGLISLHRYADDILILSPRQDLLAPAEEQAREYLARYGLTLNPAKTARGHSLRGQNPGFCFLGFHVRQRLIRNSQKDLVQVTFRPLEKRVRRQKDKLKELVWGDLSKTPEQLVKKLAPVWLGWRSYFGISHGSATALKEVDDHLTMHLRHWCRRTRSGISAEKMMETLRGAERFGDQDNHTRHATAYAENPYGPPSRWSDEANEGPVDLHWPGYFGK
jgi:RNA-directed DNA polymerase